MEGEGDIKQSKMNGKIDHTIGTGKGHGRPKKLHFSPAAARRLGGGLDIGSKVVVRWSDGLFYSGKVLRVDETNDRCQIMFEDSTTFFVLFKDIHRAPGDGEVSCYVCKGETSEARNRILLCDNCGLGYHQSCHQPMLSDKDKVCKLCLFAARLKNVDIPKCTLAQNGAGDSKSVLPYKVNILTWDAQHRTNVEQCYCYCGGPGDWYCKMLQCCRCRQWFHEACVQCLSYPLLYGDRFFLFVCCNCNHGQEYIKRLPFKWVDVVHLALFNLTLCATYKYYDLDMVLIPWITKELPNLGIDNLLEGKSVQSHDIRSKIEAALLGHKSKFVSGREVKKKHTLWGLTLRIPPNAPTVVVPLSGVVNEEVLSDPNVKGRKIKHILPAQSQSPIPLKYPSRSSLDCNMSVHFKNSLSTKAVLETNNNGLMNGVLDLSDFSNLNHSPCTNTSESTFYTIATEESEDDEDPMPDPKARKKLLRKHKAKPKNSSKELEEKMSETKPKVPETKLVVPAMKPPVPDSKSTLQPVKRGASPHSSSPFVLDRLVNVLPNFLGNNNPFMTEVESETSQLRLKHFETRMLVLRKEYASEIEAFKLARTAAENCSHSPLQPIQSQKNSPSKQLVSQSEQMQPVRGVKRKQFEDPGMKLALKDSVRRSQRSRMHAERYQHLLDSFPRHAPKPDPNEAPAQRWKWRSIVDQLRYGEKFQVLARRTGMDGKQEFLIQWDE